MALSKQTLLAATLCAATAMVSTAPVQAGPWLLPAAVSAPDGVEQVGWRGRRNGALVAGAIGLGVLGIAAAAAASEHRYEERVYSPYGGLYDERPAYGHGYGYGYQEPSYGYAPAPVYQQRYVYEDAPYHARPRHRSALRPNYHDYGRGLERSRDPAGNN